MCHALSLSKSEQLAVLVATILATAMAFIDSTALNVVLPSLQQDMAIDGSQMLWVVNGYALFLSALLLAGGSLGDLYGRMRVFMTGILIFTGASVWCGFTNSAPMLIAARCVQGVGGALMVPGSLSLISALFPQKQRGWAIGTWSMFSSITTVLGPPLGGWFASLGLWQLVFFINVPLAVVSLVLLFLKVPESKEPESGQLDIKGTLLGVVSLVALTYGFIEVPRYGLDHRVIRLSLIVGAVLLIGFILYERRAAHPMMPPELFQLRMFSSTNTITLLMYGALGGFLFFFPLNLIQVKGYSSKVAGLAMLPMGLLIALLSRGAGHWSDRHGVRLPLILGPAVASLGFYLFSLPGITGGPADYWTTYFPAISALGIGMGITVAPLTTAVMNAVPQSRTGTASGVNNTIARTAGVLAVAVMGAVALIQFEDQVLTHTQSLDLPEQVQEELQREIPKLAEARAPENATPAQQENIDKSIKQAFVDAFRQLALIACILTGIGSLIAWLFVGHGRQT